MECGIQEGGFPPRPEFQPLHPGERENLTNSLVWTRRGTLCEMVANSCASYPKETVRYKEGLGGGGTGTALKLQLSGQLTV